jgi:hypothetical protein
MVDIAATSFDAMRYVFKRDNARRAAWYPHMP